MESELCASLVRPDPGPCRLGGVVLVPQIPVRRIVRLAPGPSVLARSAASPVADQVDYLGLLDLGLLDL